MPYTRSHFFSTIGSRHPSRAFSRGTRSHHPAPLVLPQAIHQGQLLLLHLPRWSVSLPELLGNSAKGQVEAKNLFTVTPGRVFADVTVSKLLRTAANVGKRVCKVLRFHIKQLVRQSEDTVTYLRASRSWVTWRWSSATKFAPRTTPQKSSRHASLARLATMPLRSSSITSSLLRAFSTDTLSLWLACKIACDSKTRI